MRPTNTSSSACGVQRHGVSASARVVHDPDSGHFGQKPPGVVGRDGVFEFYVHRRTVRDVDGTRTHVADTAMSGMCIILRVSLIIWFLLLCNRLRRMSR